MTAVWAVLYITLLVGKAALVLLAVARSKSTKADVSNLPSCTPIDVTVVTPILSGDPTLTQMLESNVVALSTVAFCWLVDVDDVTAQDIAYAIQRDNPSRNIQIVRCDSAPDGVNPKTFKLNAALPLIATPVILVLDDDALLTAAALDTLLRGLQTGDLVTALPFYRESRTVGGQLMSQFVNNNSAMTYLPPTVFAAPITINGMCYATRSAYLRELTGFAPILQHLTDDLALALHIRAYGGSLVQTIAPVSIVTTISSMVRYRQQMHRWFLFATLLVRGESVAMQVCIAVTTCASPVMLWLLLFAAASAPSVSSAILIVVVMLCRSLTLRALQQRLTGAARHHPFWSMISELAQPLHLLHALVDRTIVWRSRRYRVRAIDDFHIA